MVVVKMIKFFYLNMEAVAVGEDEALLLQDQILMEHN
jgi:hypothetical protein